MSDSLSTLLRGLAEALTPYLSTPEVDITSTVQEVIADEYDFDDFVDRAISDYDFDDIVGDRVTDIVGDINWSDHDVITHGDFRPEDYDLMDASDIDVAICEGVENGIDQSETLTEKVRDIVTEELLNTGAVVTVDNILSVLQGALSNAAAKAERAA